MWRRELARWCKLAGWLGFTKWLDFATQLRLAFSELAIEWKLGWLIWSISARISECDLNVQHLTRLSTHGKESQVPRGVRLHVESDIRDDVSPIPPHQRLVHPAVGVGGVHEDTYGVVLLVERH